MTVKQKAARAKFKAAIAEAKKLRAKNPKLSQAQAVKQAWAILYSKDKAKKVGSVKKKAAPKKKADPKKKAVKKISEKSILNKIHKVKHDVERLDEAQHSHMMGRIVKNMIKKYVVIYNLPGAKSKIEYVTATSLLEAKKIASAFKKHHKIKGTTKVTLYSK